jgi:hypothetical protein
MLSINAKLASLDEGESRQYLQLPTSIVSWMIVPIHRHGRKEMPTSFVEEPPSSFDASRLAAAISLDPESALALRQAAAREGLSPAELVSVVLREYLRGPERPPPRGIGAYRSGRSDVSTRAEELLRKAARGQRK